MEEKSNSSHKKDEMASEKQIDSSQKITNFFPILRTEGRAKMCGVKCDDSKQKEMLKKMKGKESMTLRSKRQDKSNEKASSSETSSSSQTKEKIRNISVAAALKTPLSQVLRKNMESSDSKKEIVGRSNPLKSSDSSGKATDITKRNLSDSEGGRVLRQKAPLPQKPPRAYKRRTLLQTPVGNDKPKSSSGNSSEGIRGRTTQKIATSAIDSLIEGAKSDNDANGPKQKKPYRKRHFRGGTYGLYLTPARKRKKKMKSSADESKDEDGSVTSTENNSFLDSEDGNSLVSEDFFTPSEKSLIDEDHAHETQICSKQPSDLTEEKKMEKPASSDLVESDVQKVTEETPKLAKSEEKIEITADYEENTQNAADLFQELEEMQWEPVQKASDDADETNNSQTIKAPQYDDISSESFSNSLHFSFKKNSPKDSEENEIKVDLALSEKNRELNEADSSNIDDAASKESEKIVLPETPETLTLHDNISDMFDIKDDSNIASSEISEGKEDLNLITCEGKEDLNLISTEGKEDLNLITSEGKEDLNLITSEIKEDLDLTSTDDMLVNKENLNLVFSDVPQTKEDTNILPSEATGSKNLNIDSENLSEDKDFSIETLDTFEESKTDSNLVQSDIVENKDDSGFPSCGTPESKESKRSPFSLVLTDENKQDSNSALFTNDNKQDSNSVLFTNENKQDSISVPFTNENKQNSDSLPLTGENKQNSDSLPLPGENKQNSDSFMFPIENKQDSNSSLYTNEKKQNSDSFIFPIESKQEFNTSLFTNEEKQNSDSFIFPAENKQESNTSLFTNEKRQNSGSFIFTNEKKKDSNSVVFPSEKQHDTNSVVFSNEKQHNSDSCIVFPSEKHQDSNSFVFPSEKRQISHSFMFPTEKKLDSDSFIFPAEDKQESDSFIFSAGKRQESSAFMFSSEKKQDSNSNFTFSSEKRQEANSFTFSNEKRLDSNFIFSSGKRQESDCLLFPNENKQDSNSLVFPVEIKHKSDCLVFPHENKQNPNCLVFPNKNKQDSNCLVFPNENKQNANNLVFPNENKQDSSCLVFPNENKQDSSCLVFPNQSNQESNCHVFPNENKQDSNSLVFPVGIKQKSDCLVFSNENKQESDCLVFPNENRQVSNCLVFPNENRQDSNCLVFPNENKQDSTCLVFPNKTKHDSNSLVFSTENRQETNSLVFPRQESNCLIFPRQESNSLVFPSDNKQESNSLIFPTGNKQESNSLIFPTGNKQESNSLIFSAENKQESNSLVFPTENKQDSNSLTFPRENKQTSNSLLFTNENNQVSTPMIFTNEIQNFNSSTFPLGNKHDSLSISFANENQQDFDSSSFTNRNKHDSVPVSFANENKHVSVSLPFACENKRDSNPLSFPDETKQDSFSLSIANENKNDVETLSFTTDIKNDSDPITFSGKESEVRSTVGDDVMNTVGDEAMDTVGEDALDTVGDEAVNICESKGQDDNFKSQMEVDNPDQEGNQDDDAQSTIANCVKSRQRIKRRFTDDIVDTDLGILSMAAMASVKKVLAKQETKDVIENFTTVATHNEAKKGSSMAKIECVFNYKQAPIKSCTCEADSYEANLSKNEEVAFCQAVDCIDDKLLGCSNPVVTSRLVRPSVKIPFTIMCETHLWRLKHHHACPYCGLFCSQGTFIRCAANKCPHFYHEMCQSKEDGTPHFCLHCGSKVLQRVHLEMHMNTPPNFFLSQSSNVSVPDVSKARISFSESPDFCKKDDDEPIQMYKIEDSGKILSSAGLPEGSLKEELENLISALSDDKVRSLIVASDEFYDMASSGNVLKILYMLAKGFDPNYKFANHEGETALHAATAGGHITVVHLLMQAGAVNDSLNERMYTPLMLAVENGHKDVVHYLVKKGALTDFKGENGMSSLHLAAKSGNLEILKILMTSREADIDAQDDGGWTPIVWASEHDHLNVVRYLLKRGANPNIRDNEGNIGLHWSAFSGSVEISYLYLDYGCDINSVNELGDTPLHIAARQDSYPCVTLFLSRGADVTILNKANKLPAECCIDKNSDTYLSLSLNMLLKKITGKYQHKAEKIIHRDISRGKEQLAIQCVNAVDDEMPPVDFLYVTENCETMPIKIDRTITSLQSCHCEDDCSTASCSCASISYQCWYDKEGLLLPEFNLLDPPMLFECNRACSCWSLNCHNRVLQNGITCRLQLIRTKGKGWGVRALKDIPKGAFICEYVGELISDSAADKRSDDSYLFDLDNRDGETYCLDARYYGNISRFINHLCEPNLVPVKVYVDHQDLNFPRIAFFSSRDIKQYEELGFDYGEKFWAIKYKFFTCECGSPKCKYSKDSIHVTLANYYRRLKEEQMEEAAATQQPVTVVE